MADAGSKRVVAGVEFSAIGRRVADRARLVAEGLGADLELVHVVEPVAEALIEPALARLMRERQEEAAEEITAWCRARAAVPVSMEVVKGAPAWELTAKGKDADLVVVGSSSEDVFSVGPTARRVARKATTHTLLVRRQPRVPYRRILVAVDFSDASRAGVETALTMFPDADVTLVYVLPARFDHMLADAGLFQEEVEASRGRRMDLAFERMDEYAQEWEGRVRTLVVDGPTMGAIDETVRHRNSDLVVAASRGATATRMVLLGTVAEGLLDAVPCDVLIARVRSAFRRP
ncbi:MAG: universal stress protein [Acidimicrobiales bacterium]|nr:universal stress protein [Acidimicrobiales bacterium]